MKIYLLFGQRKYDYPGQYAPELLEACDDLTMEENSEWIHHKKNRYDETNDFISTEIFEMILTPADSKKITDRLNKHLFENVTGNLTDKQKYWTEGN